MSWSVGWDPHWKRDIGYGVPAVCDHPECDKEIDRGLGYVCGEQPYGGEVGCGLYFCDDHLYFSTVDDVPALCARCSEGQPPFDAKLDVGEWVAHKMSDPSWAAWRAEQGT